MIALSLFRRAADSTPVPKQLTWTELCAELGPHDTSHTDKRETHAFSPARYPDGARARSKKTVLDLGFGVLDLDHLTDEQLTDITPTFAQAGYIFYTTWSHAKEPGWCARLLVPFSRPVLRTEWEAFWPRFNAAYGGLGDPACKDPSRIYFAPACLPEDLPEAIYEVGEGPPLDVDALLQSAAPALLEQPPAEVVRTEVVVAADVKALATRLKRRTNPYEQTMGRRLATMVTGEPFAEPGERDDTIFKLSGLLAESFPDANPLALAAMFAPSLALMGEDCPTHEDVAAKIERHQDRLAAEERQQAAEQLQEHQRLIREAFANGRIHPYTDPELEEFCAQHEVDLDGLRRRWIIQHERAYHFLLKGQYTPAVGGEAAANAALRDLSPASTAGVELWKMTRDGIKQKTPQELVRDYGTVVHGVTVSLTAEHSSVNPVTRVLVEAPCPLRPLEPELDPDVDAWLELLCGEEYETVMDWLAVVTDLDEPCAALYLDGSPGTGKTLLADGLARLWTQKGPTALEHAMAEFNDALCHCPLVLADESIPRDWRGRARTAELRQFIQARTRTLNRKFLPVATIEGAARLIITANNRELLVSQEHLTPNDIAAITNRLIYVKADPAASALLEQMGMDRVRTFVTEDRIARHALWLVRNRTVQRGKRFYVEGADSDLHRMLTTAAGLRSAVCNWLVMYLLQPAKVDNTGELLIRTYQGSLYATSRGLSQAWDRYETHESAPQAGRLSAALSGLSRAKRQLRAGDKRQTNYWELDPENLIAWAENNGYATRETIEQALEIDSQGANEEAQEES